MSMNLAYNYVEIDPETNMCIDFMTTSHEETERENIIQVPVNDPEYLGKYYINGEWYEDAEGIIPWTSSLL